MRVFTQPGSFATGASRQQVGPCPLCLASRSNFRARAATRRAVGRVLPTPVRSGRAAHIPANLLLVTTSREVTHAHFAVRRRSWSVQLGIRRVDFFHLTYSTIKNPASVATYLRNVAKKEAPSGFTYIDCDEIRRTDSRPTGLAARYKDEFGEIKVVFLILDVAQYIQRTAATIAAKTNPRNKKPKSTGRTIRDR